MKPRWVQEGGRKSHDLSKSSVSRRMGGESPQCFKNDGELVWLVRRLLDGERLKGPVHRGSSRYPCSAEKVIFHPVSSEQPSEALLGCDRPAYHSVG